MKLREEKRLGGDGHDIWLLGSSALFVAVAAMNRLI